MDLDTERRVICDVLKGDRERFAAIVDAYQTPVFNLAYRMTGSYGDAEDLAQETFVRAFEQLARYDPGRKFFTWLYTIALNLIRSHLRRRSRAAAGVERAPTQGADRRSDPEALLMEEEALRDLTRALLRLPRRHMELIVLRFYQGLSFDDIAEIEGMSVSAAKMRVYRGLERLRGLMGGGPENWTG
jgi:RNA polymerase sigma-70 factor (ECF subfamily)